MRRKMRGSLKVPCPFCGAKAGRDCRTSSGRGAARSHRQRAIALAVAAADLHHTFRLTEGEVEDHDAVDMFWHADPANSEVYAPRESSLVAETGAWAMIRRALPALEGRVDQHFRIGRVFWVQQIAETDAEGFRPDGMYKVKCPSPWGEVCFWPYEYSVISTESLMAAWQDGELIFHALNMEAARLDDVVFYARSRGISLEVAAVMALGAVSEDDDEDTEMAGPVGWFEPREDLAPEMEALAARVNTPLARHIAENPRVSP